METHAVNQSDSYYVQIVGRRDLAELIELCQSLGIKDFIRWDRKSDDFSISIPFRNSQKEAATGQLKIAKLNKLNAAIEKSTLGSGDEIDVLTIGCKIAPKYKDRYSAFELSNGLDEHPKLLDIIKEAYRKIHTFDMPEMPPRILLNGIKAVEIDNIPSDKEIFSSQTALLYTVSDQASLAIPFNLVDTDIHEALHARLSAYALDQGGLSSAVHARNARIEKIQIDSNKFKELKSFAESLGLSFS